MTEEQRKVLAHVVLDPDAWLTHAVETFGEERAEEMLAAKVERWLPDYMAESAAPGYKTRAAKELG